jgi:hypothetical protein
MGIRLAVMLVRHGNVLLKLVVKSDFKLMSHKQVAVICTIQLVAVGANGPR